MKSGSVFSFFPLCCVLVSLTVFPACHQEKQQEFDRIYQWSTIKALVLGHYDGELTFAELRKKGDFGIGTFDALDGEMIALEGIFYQFTADGKSHIVPNDTKTPFAVVTNFREDWRHQIEDVNGFDQLSQVLDSLQPNPNHFYALKLKGSFKEVKTRSVDKQEKPYKLLTEIIENEEIHLSYNVSGTMVGFYFPSFTKDLNVPGYHFHFIDNSRSFGGHILDLHIDKSDIFIDQISKLEFALPSSSSFKDLQLDEDQSAAVEMVERK